MNRRNLIAAAVAALVAQAVPALAREGLPVLHADGMGDDTDAVEAYVNGRPFIYGNHILTELPQGSLCRIARPVVIRDNYCRTNRPIELRGCSVRT